MRQINRHRLSIAHPSLPNHDLQQIDKFIDVFFSDLSPSGLSIEFVIASHFATLSKVERAPIPREHAE